MYFCLSFNEVLNIYNQLTRKSVSSMISIKKKDCSTRQKGLSLVNQCEPNMLKIENAIVGWTVLTDMNGGNKHE